MSMSVRDVFAAGDDTDRQCMVALEVESHWRKKKSRNVLEKVY